MTIIKKHDGTGIPFVCPECGEKTAVHQCVYVVSVEELQELRLEEKGELGGVHSDWVEDEVDGNRDPVYVCSDCGYILPVQSLVSLVTFILKERNDE